MRCSFVTADVFTRTPFGGNPLAVFPDAQGLSSAVMQRIASEINYSEITFVLPPDDPANTAEVRIFTPRSEVPFAGHPNVGTAYLLAVQGQLFGRPLGDSMRFEEGAGIVAVEIERDGGRPTGARILAPKPLSTGPELTVDEVAACLGIAASDVRTTTHPPIFGSVGLRFLLVELNDRAALVRAAPQLSAFAECDRRYPQEPDMFCVFAYTRAERGADCDLHARMFAPLDGIVEDPATGSANAALTALLASLAPDADARLELVVRQGDEIGRPSVLRLRATKSGGRVGHVTVAGDCVAMIEGALRL
jgi:trans-2,3-dihydro-3-hydroxyanthranilate isomerase